MADFQQNFLNSFQSGLGIGQKVREVQDKNRINELSSQGYTALPERRQELLGQIAAVDAKSAATQDKSFSDADERRNATLANMSRLLTSAPEQARPGLYQRMLPALGQFGMSELPQEYNAQTGPVIDQAARSIASAYGGNSSASGVQSTYVNDQNQRVALMRDGTTRVLGNNDPGANYQNLERDINGTPTQLTFNRRTGEYSNAAMGGQPQAQQRQSAVPGFGIAETDNYVRNILGKVQVDPNASPEQQAEQLLPALIQQESGGNPNAVSPKGAAGLTQVMPATGRDPGFGVSPLQNNSPEENVRFGREYLTAMLRRYPGRPDLALAAYNAGPGVADRFASPVASAAGGALTGRRAEDEAAAVESAKLGVQNANFGNELSQAQQLEQVKTQAAIDKASAEAQMKIANERSQAVATRMRDASESLGLIDEALPLLDKATGSAIGAGVDATNAFFGRSTEGAQANADLKIISAGLVQKVPRFEGPQSDRDVQSYREAAGNLGDETLPVETRKSAARAIVRLNQKYLDQQASAPAGGNNLRTTNQVTGSPRRARNPQTGQTLILVNGQWVPE